MAKSDEALLEALLIPPGDPEKVPGREFFVSVNFSIWSLSRWELEAGIYLGHVRRSTLDHPRDVQRWLYTRVLVEVAEHNPALLVIAAEMHKRMTT